jgi:ATP-binding cassette subfamily B protein
MTLAASRFACAVRARMFEHLQSLSLAFHQRARSGDLITRFTHDVERLRDAASLSVVPLVANMLIVTTVLGVMFWVNVELACWSVVFLPILFFSSLRSSKRIQGLVREQRRRDGEVASVAAESIAAIKSVQALSLMRVLQDVFRKSNDGSLTTGARTQRAAARLERLVEVLMAVATAVILWRGVHLVVEGVITAGTLLLFMSYLAQLVVPLRQSAKSMTRLSRALASSERIAEILVARPTVVQRHDATVLKPFRELIRFEHVSFRYDRTGWALSDLNFAIRAGERVAFVGMSGAGKSTILSLLLRLYDPHEGRILIDGVDIREVTLDSLRGQMGTVLQESILFGVSLRENIRYGLPSASDNEIVVASRLANAHEFVATLPQGYDSIVGERGAALSGGQRQRIALARALIRQAPLLLLDEPTTGLDAQSQREVLDALERSRPGVTTVMVTHDLRSVRGFDQIYCMENGFIVEHGTHEVLYAEHGRYWKMCERQAREHGADISLFTSKPRAGLI